jgi:predicted TIM-barrel fold metal-dependent hydrolase
MVDFHTHLGNLDFPRPNNRSLTVEQLIDRMNRTGVGTAVLLPLVSPEATGTHFSTFDAIEAADKYPERLVPFCCVDPRRENPVDHMDAFAKMGCKGFGEHKVGLTIDDPRSKALYRRCGDLGWCVVMHLDPGLNVDAPGLPALEKLLKEMSETNFVMHGPAWWSEISTENMPRGGYPKGKIKSPGRAGILLSEYSNLYADLSAASAYNALTRDPDYAHDFVRKFLKKLIFGTDYLRPHQQLPMAQLIEELMGPLSGKEIFHENAVSLLTPGK